MKNKKIFIILSIFLIIIFATVIIILKTGLKPVFLEKENSKISFFDFDNDGINEEIKIKNNKAYFLKNNKIIWESKDEYKIDKFLSGDFNNDGKTEIGFSVWKKGSYGDALPFWLEKNDDFFGNHLFLYKLENNNIKMAWGSSTLANPIIDFKLLDINNDNKKELIILEGDYDNLNDENSRYFSIWHWDEWLFYKDFESEKGNYENLK